MKKNFSELIWVVLILFVVVIRSIGFYYDSKKMTFFRAFLHDYGNVMLLGVLACYFMFRKRPPTTKK